MIHILITLGALPPEKRAPVVEALRANLSGNLVQEIHVLTEAPTADDMLWLTKAAGDQAHRVILDHITARPTFQDMLNCANRLLVTRAQTVAIMNGDISIASDGDAQRMLEALETLEARSTSVALALTRHERAGDQIEIELYEPNGIPNTISADAWVFQKPVAIAADLFYSPGQMNCDMMFAYDLLHSGYRLFNPCLDVTIVHHEASKEEAFYAEQNEADASLELLYTHVRRNKVDPWNYFGAPWVRSEWLSQGYRPLNNSTHGRRIILAVPEAAEDRLGTLLPEISDLAETHDLEVQILCEGDPDRLVRRYAAALSNAPQIWLTRPKDSIAATRHAFLKGEQYNFERMAFVSDPARIDAALMTAADAVFVTLRPEPVRPVPAQFGCTLVTAVFRSDPFLAGFLANSRSLTGYDRMIEHVFLVSAMSEQEIARFDTLLAEQDNAVLLWHREDPGLYECWNIGIRIARTDYVSNANVDDLRDSDHVVALVRDLETHPECNVAATALNPFTEFPADGTLPTDRPGWYADRAGRFGFFDIANLSQDDPPKLDPFNMPHCMPVWRRALHDRFGWFDEPRYGTYADWAFWLKVLRYGGTGWINPNPLGFYFVNPTSHNRRGSDLEQRHKVVEGDFLADFLDRAADRPIRPATVPEVVPKLQLQGKAQEFGQHRNSFNTLINALEPLERPDGEGTVFIPFLERQFVWGNAPGEAGSTDPRPLDRPWIGILHVPFEAPDWFQTGEIYPERFMATELWHASRPFCRGVITLADDLAADLHAFDPDLPILSVRHPTSFDAPLFDPAAHAAAPTVVQIGDWLRKLQAIHRLRAPGYRRVMLTKQWTTAYLQNEICQFGNDSDPQVEVRHMVPNEEYDQLLQSSVVLCLLYGTAANNVVIECIARATPILINPLPAAVEYLGRDYPLYVRDEADADAALAEPDRIAAAHAHLLRRRSEIDLSYEGFCRDIAESGVYEAL